MAAEAQAELVFIPGPVMGHLPSMIEVARKLAAQHHDRISVTFLIMRYPSNDDKVESLIQSLEPNSLSTYGYSSTSNNGSVNFLELPPLDQPFDVESEYFLRDYAGAYKPIIQEFLLRKNDQQLAGIVVDMLWTNMVDVANELGIQSYIFFAASAAMLRLMLHFESFGLPATTSPTTAGDDETSTAVKVAGFKNPVPLQVWPEMILDKEGNGAETMLSLARSFLKTKGILINTFDELEPNIIRSFTSDINSGGGGAAVPPIYPVGPLINLHKDSTTDINQKNKVIMSWLDSQPTRSVVFLCFGSRGTFDTVQLREISTALEHCDHRFLWSLRRKPDKRCGPIRSLTEYEDFKEVLPEGFLERTAQIGKVIGWAPQASVLGHRAVGAFISHCGWNSTLEGVCNGVPILTWSIYFDQHINAFSMVREMGLAAEIKMGFRNSFHSGEAIMVVAGLAAKDIERGIRKVMDMEGEGKRLRERVDEVSKARRKALLGPGDCSYDSMVLFVDDVLRNMSSLRI